MQGELEGDREVRGVSSKLGLVDKR
jgi:hypothetical protein